MRIWLRTGVPVLAAAVVVSVAIATGQGSGPKPPGPGPEPVPGPVANGIRLVSYANCADMLGGLRRQTAKNVGQYGIDQPNYMLPSAEDSTAKGAAAAPSAGGAAPDHSTTNVHEVGVDEPDIVKSDGNRIVTVSSRGELQVIDTATRKVTGSVALTTLDQGWGPADLLLHGDRALVILPGGFTGAKGPTLMPDGSPTTTYVLVDLSGKPKVLSSMTPRGSYLDARMVGSTVRLVVRSQPHIMFPQTYGGVGSQQLARSRAAVRKAPISAWLPSYQVIDANGARTTRTVPCGQVSHPADYTGLSMLTIYTVDLSDQSSGLDDLSPISLAADGETVYATPTSLYVTSNPRWFFVNNIDVPLPAGGVINQSRPAAVPIPPRAPAEQTQIHRFDISGPGAPRYVASGKVKGRMLNQYSLSDYQGYLRIATTSGTAIANEPGQNSGSSTSTSSVYVLRADTLAKVGEVDGLGRHQRIYSVRFIGPVGYVVTFQQMDPLYTLDLRDPTAPRIAGQLELTGYSAYVHPAGDGRLIGIGQDATVQGRPTGLQVSLFDVSDPAHPKRLAHLVKANYTSAAESDPHAFFYWPESGTVVLPTDNWQDGVSGARALVLKVTDSTVALTASLTHPVSSASSYQGGITRALMVGDSLWTMSEAGFLVSDANTLHRQDWISLN